MSDAGIDLTRIGLIVLGLLMALALHSAAQAGEATSTGQPVLTVSGSIARGEGDATATFDRAALESLGTVMIETTTPWTEGVQRFEGVLVRKLLAAVGATGDTVKARALNRYVALIPAGDFEKYDVILAFRQNGRDLGEDEMGPLFIVYPFDGHAALRHAQTYSRAVWQLSELEVL
jgi:hypothetical protein